MKAQGRLDDVSETNFVYCGMMSDLAAIQLYLASGMSPDARNAQGNTALVAALDHDPQSPWSGQAEAVVRLLVEKGADVNRAGADGRTPLAIATAKSWTPVVELLKRAGAR